MKFPTSNILRKFQYTFFTFFFFQKKSEIFCVQTFTDFMPPYGFYFFFYYFKYKLLYYLYFMNTDRFILLYILYRYISYYTFILRTKRSYILFPAIELSMVSFWLLCRFFVCCYTLFTYIDTICIEYYADTMYCIYTLHIVHVMFKGTTTIDRWIDGKIDTFFLH